MPVYNEDTFNYEILLRFGDAGPNKGQLTGASRTTITQTTKDGVPIATNINAPEQLALIAGEEGELLSGVLGEVNAATIVLNGQLQAGLADLNTIAAQQLEQLTQLRGELDAVRGELEDAQRALADMQGKSATTQEFEGNETV
jgi:VIT1/CCC1 family predicted Fe2+/Mn2+ transporter